MKKILFLAMVLFAPIVNAANNDICTSESKCEDLPACERLGYTKNRYCPEGYVTCPFDSDYIWCKTYTCEMGGLLSVDSEKVALAKAKGYICKKVKFHGLTCNECDTIDSKCRYDDVNKGKGTLAGEICGNNKYPECESNCPSYDLTAEILAIEGAVPVREICTACMLDEIISTDFTCADSYKKVEDASGLKVKDGKKYKCVPAACPEATTYRGIPYEATGAVNCMVKEHAQGWRFEINGVSGGVACSRCVPKDCPLGTEKDLSGCPNDVGYMYIVNGYSGESVCGYCESLRCDDPYAETLQSINDCPTLGESTWSAAKGWTFEQSLQQAGDKICGLCVPKVCENAEYSKSFQSLSDCPNQKGYEFKFDTAHFYGNKYCGKCVEKTCATGSKINLTMEECVAEYRSSFGTRVVDTGEYSGGSRCQKCECDPSSCMWKTADIGAGGQGVDACCDGLSYRSCERKATCEGDEVATIENAKRVTRCTACGHTYKKVEECYEDYKIENNRCVKKTCADWSLKSSPLDCAAGFVGVASEEHVGCFSCKVKTCALWGEENNKEWFEPGTTCNQGYAAKTYNVNVGGTMVGCIDCSTCVSKKDEGYIWVSSESLIPSEVLSADKFKSCNGYEYCAESCAFGWTKDGCACSPVNCTGYTQVSGLSKHDGNIWTDTTGALKYEMCQTGEQKKFKLLGCMDGYSDVACDSGIGQIKAGATQGDYKCYKCNCDITQADQCRWDSTNIGDGKGVTICCDNKTYKGCEKDTTKCNYTLTEKPQNAAETESCTACKVTYYHVKKCKTGYKGEKCEECDTDNGYGMCGGVCAKKPNCGDNGTAICSTTGWQCKCQTGYKGDLCNACDEAKEYYECKGKCLKKPTCIHGTAVCGETSWGCECEYCYAGDTCNTCDSAEGCKDFGNGCVKDQNCNGHGTFNGETCVCDQCYYGETCELADETYCRDGNPKTCESEGYSKECQASCQLCTEVSPKVKTVGGVELDCYDVTDKSCADFCGSYDTLTAKKGLDSSAYACAGVSGEKPVLVSGTKIYAKLQQSVSDAALDNVSGCGIKCYYNDTNCSAGEKLTAQEKADMESQGYVCIQKGYTPAGSMCYECVNDVCTGDLIKEGDVSAKEAEGFACAKKTGVLTANSTQCYE